MTAVAQSHPYSTELTWLWVSFVPVMATFAVLAGALLEGLRRSRRKPSRG